MGETTGMAAAGFGRQRGDARVFSSRSHGSYRWPCAALALVLLALMLPVPLGGRSGAARAADVVGDDRGNAYLGSGGLLAPPGVLASRSRAEAAGCADCRWAVTAICRVDGQMPTAPGQDGCVAVPAWCPDGRDHVWLWRSGPDTGGSWEIYDTICRPRVTLQTTRTVGAVLRNRFLELIGPPRPDWQPGGRALVRVPVVFAAGGPTAPLDRSEVLGGLPVRLRAEPQWSWDFGDGAGLRTGSPGGRWPQSDVAHSYRRAGAFEVSVRVSWPASFTVAGLGPFPVDQTVTTQGRTRVVAVAARAVVTARQ